MTTTEYDAERAEAFAGRMLETLNSGAVAVMISVGHRTGLFDALAEIDTATSQELADAASLDERYVREWLGAMTTGRIVEYEPATEKYRLPAEHASWLTRAASPDNLAVTAQWIPTLASVEEDIVRCFREGGGVPYERFDRFHEVMAEESNQTVLSVLFTHILPLISGADERLQAGISALDLGCGRGPVAASRAYLDARLFDPHFQRTEAAIQFGVRRVITQEVVGGQIVGDAPHPAVEIVTVYDGDSVGVAVRANPMATSTQTDPQLVEALRVYAAGGDCAPGGR
jgi:hypothetical protein